MSAALDDVGECLAPTPPTVRQAIPVVARASVTLAVPSPSRLHQTIRDAGLAQVTAEISRRAHAGEPAVLSFGDVRALIDRGARNAAQSLALEYHGGPPAVGPAGGPP